MRVKEFDKLSKRDFENGAVLDAIRKALRKLEIIEDHEKKTLEQAEIWHTNEPTIKVF